MILPEAGEAKGRAAPAELIHDLGVVALPQPEGWRLRARTALSISMSLLLHSSAIAAAMLLAAEQTDIGAISVPTQAISVEIVSSSVLESMQQKETKEEAAQAQATDSKTGAEAAEASEATSKVAPPEKEPDKEATEDAGKVASAETEIKEVAPQRSEEPERAIPKPLGEEPAPVVAPPPPVTQPQASEDDDATKEAAQARETAEQARKEARQREERIEREAREQRQHEQRDEERRKEARRKEEERKERKHKKAEQGGVTAKSSAAASGSSGRVSASAGSILTYAARVRAQVAGRKPSGAGERGTAIVAFGVTTSGGLSYANISKSSGNSGLDRLAVSAVRGAAPFPQPPAGASASQLRFTIPFHFQ